MKLNSAQNDIDWINVLLRWSYMLMLGARAYQAWFFDLPFRSFFWDQNLLQPITHIWQLEWHQYLTLLTESSFLTLQRIIALVWILTSIVIGSPYRESKIAQILKILTLIFLVFTVFCIGKEAFYRIGQFMEYSLQIFVALVLVVPTDKRVQVISRWASPSIALCFLGHGLYAIGYYPIPVHFVQMTISILGVTETEALLFLKIMGILDLVAVFAIWIGGTFRIAALVYCILWGFLTAAARIIAHVHYDFFLASMHQWWFQSVFRSPHFIVPLIAYILNRNKNKKSIHERKNCCDRSGHYGKRYRSCFCYEWI